MSALTSYGEITPRVPSWCGAGRAHSALASDGDALQTIAAPAFTGNASLTNWLALVSNISIISCATSRSSSVIITSVPWVRVPPDRKIRSSVGRATDQTPSGTIPFVAPPNSSLAGRSSRVTCHYDTPGALTHPHPSCGPKSLGYPCKVNPSDTHTPTSYLRVGAFGLPPEQNPEGINTSASLMGPEDSRLSTRYVGSNPIGHLGDRRQNWYWQPDFYYTPHSPFGPIEAALSSGDKSAASPTRPIPSGG